MIQLLHSVGDVYRWVN